MRRFLRLLTEFTRAGADSPSFIALGQLAASGLAIVSAPIVARAIGPSGRGETAAVLAAFYIWPIVAALGMQLEIRRAAATGFREPALRRARDLMLLLVLPSAAVAFILDFSLFATLSNETRIVAFAGVTAAPLMVSWMCDQSVLIADRRYRAVAIIQIIQPSVYLLAVTVGWICGWVSVPYVLGASMLGTLATTICAASFTKVSIRGPRASTLGLLRASARYSGSSIAEASASRLDQLIALQLLGATQSGLYAVAATIGGLALPLGHALAADSFNEIAQAQNEEERLKTRVKHIRSAVAAGLVAGATLAAASPLLVPLLFGSQFTGSILPAVLLSVGGAAAVPAFVASLVLAAEGRGREMTLAQITRVAVGLVGLVSLGPLLGAIGASIASLVGSWILLAILTVRTTGSIRAWLVGPSDFRTAIRRLLRGS